MGRTKHFRARVPRREEPLAPQRALVPHWPRRFAVQQGQRRGWDRVKPPLDAPIDVKAEPSRYRRDSCRALCPPQTRSKPKRVNSISRSSTNFVRKGDVCPAKLRTERPRVVVEPVDAALALSSPLELEARDDVRRLFQHAPRLAHEMDAPSDDEDDSALHSQPMKVQ